MIKTINVTETKEVDIPRDSELGMMMSIFDRRQNFTVYLEKDESGFNMEINYKPTIGPGYLIKHKFGQEFNLHF